MTKRVDVTEIPEVIEFMNAKEELEAFQARNAHAMEELRQLTDAYNTSLQAAEKKVRGLKVSCGPFDLYSTVMKYDPEKLYSAIGREEFLKLGGSVKTVAEYAIDKKAVEAAIARNDLPAEVIEVVRKEEPRYKIPEAIVLP